MHALLGLAAAAFLWLPIQDALSDGPDAQSDLLNEAPHLFHDADGGITARWVRDGELETRTFAAGAPVALPEFAHLLGESLAVPAPEPPACVWDAPKTMLVLSDVEGQYDTLLRFLTGNGVVDEDGRWAFGEGHLVGVGDMVDRGTQVTETLWLFYRLSLEAETAGGRVHFVLGNHEAMVMGGDVRYTQEKYFAAAELMDLPCEGLLGADTVLGRWLRTRNSVERIGDTVFVHAGLSPSVAGDALDFEALNAHMRTVLGEPKKSIEDEVARDLVWGRKGPLWYRGYFEKYADDYGPTPTSAQFEQILSAAGAKHVVVGHSKVKQVTPKYDSGLIAIDIPWTTPKDVRALLYRRDEVFVVDIAGSAQLLELKPQPAAE